MVDQKKKDVLVGQACTLNGKPAVIAGRLREFAIVGQIGGTVSAEFSWDAVVRVMGKDGAFRVEASRGYTKTI